MSCKFCNDNNELIETRAVFIKDTTTKLIAHKDNCICEQSRENEEKEYTKRYIFSAQIFDDNTLGISLYFDNNPDIDDSMDEHTESISAYVPINYCPICGRKFKEAADDKG